MRAGWGVGWVGGMGGGYKTWRKVEIAWGKVVMTLRKVATCWGKNFNDDNNHHSKIDLIGIALLTAK